MTEEGYIDDEAYRRRILIQLNRGEGRHSLARTVFHGQRGEVRQRYRSGQEDQLGALGLVVNVLVLWNTCYFEPTLNSMNTQEIFYLNKLRCEVAMLTTAKIPTTKRLSSLLTKTGFMEKWVQPRCWSTWKPPTFFRKGSPVHIRRIGGRGIAVRV